jgi:Flp pilus assembly protein TadG
MRNERGQFALELALLTPLLLVLVFLTFEFGRVFGSCLVITNATREGARYSITQQWCGATFGSVGSCAADTNIQARIKLTVQFLSPSGVQSCTPSGVSASTPAPIGTCNTCPATKLCVGIYRYIDANSNKINQIWAVYQVQTLTPIAGVIPFLGNIGYPTAMYVTGHDSMRSQQ